MMTTAIAAMPVTSPEPQRVLMGHFIARIEDSSPLRFLPLAFKMVIVTVATGQMSE